MIEAKGLSRSFGSRPAVTDVSLRVEPGEVVGLLGPNGAGKTTTIRLLLGLVRPVAGEAACTRPVGYLPESFVPDAGPSASSYLRFVARAKGIQDSAAVDDAMTRAGLEGLGRRPAGRLSRGQRQRLGLAQAILGSPASVILDEPTTGLDPQQIVETREVIRALRAQAAVLLSTHVLAEAAAVCDRVVMMASGRVVAVERPGEVADLEARFLRAVSDDAGRGDRAE